MLDSAKQENSNDSIKEIKGIDINVDLWQTDKPLTFSGNQRKDLKTEYLENEIALLSSKVEELTKKLNILLKANIGSSKFDDNDFDFSDNEGNTSYNDSLHKNKSGRFSSVTHIAYLYSVPLVKTENSKILSMGTPIDHNAEIDEIIDSLDKTNKMVNFRMETATTESLQNLFLIKPKIVHLSCHGDYDK